MQERLLMHLEDFPRSVLVTGCQRSGTTAIARLIRQAEGTVDFQTSLDDELDGALILAGHATCEKQGRFCFQTTYLNERHHEYAEHPNHYIVWVLRNPYSVIYSMLFNWKRFALNELFLSCGYPHMDYQDRIKFQRFGIYGIPILKRAIYAYIGKVEQVFWIMENYPRQRLAIVDYDQLIMEKERLLPALFRFADLSYRNQYARLLKASSLDKAKKLDDDARRMILEKCAALYERAMAEVTLR